MEYPGDSPSSTSKARTCLKWSPRKNDGGNQFYIQKYLSTYGSHLRPLGQLVRIHSILNQIKGLEIRSTNVITVEPAVKYSIV